MVEYIKANRHSFVSEFEYEKCLKAAIVLKSDMDDNIYDENGDFAYAMISEALEHLDESKPEKLPESKMKEYIAFMKGAEVGRAYVPKNTPECNTNEVECNQCDGYGHYEGGKNTMLTPCKICYGTGKIANVQKVDNKNHCEECNKQLESGTVFCSADCRIHYYND